VGVNLHAGGRAGEMNFLYSLTSQIITCFILYLVHTELLEG
jgi:hypothetical protein